MIRTGWIAIAIGCAGGTGCGGGGGGGGADAPAGTIDAPAGTIDAPGAPADADLRPVTVTVYDSVPPIVATAGLSVVFSHPDGTVTGVATTGADGKATGMVTAGDTVTALGVRDSWTVLDVHPGDDLTLGALDHVGTKLGTFNISGPAFAGAFDHYIAYTPCSLSGAKGVMPLQVDVMPGCGTTTDVAMVAYTAQGAPLGFVMATGVSFTPGGATTIGGTWGAMPTIAASYSGIPNADVAFMTAQRNTVFPYGTVTGGTPTQPTLTITPYTFGGTGAYVTTDAHGKPVGADTPHQVRVEPIGDADTSYALDVGANLLPWLHAPHVSIADGAVTFDDATPSAGDFAQIEIHYHHFQDANGEVWTIVAPRLATVTLPKLTGALASRNLQANDTLVGAGVTWFDTFGAHPWATARATAIDLATGFKHRAQRDKLRRSGSSLVY